MATDADSAAADKRAQVEDARQRGLSPQETPTAGPPDTTGPEAADLAVTPPAAPTVTPAETAPERVPPRHGGRFEDKRAAIIAGFREHRATQASDGDDAELRALTHDGLPPEMVPPDPPAAPQGDPPATAPAVTEPPPPAAPEPAAKRKLVVRGREVEMSQADIDAVAQKALAGEDYFDEAKKTAQEATRILRAAQEQTRVARTTQPAAHSGEGEAHAQTTEPAPPEPDGGAHSTDPLAQIVEKIQFGASDEAAQDLRKVIDQAAQTQAQETLQRERLRDEATRSRKFLRDFVEQHADLAQDPIANAAMERTLYDMQRADILALGIEEAKVPQNPTDIGDWHLWYRTNGFKVQSVPDLLEAAKGKVLAWKGVAPPTPSQQPAATAAPRIEVSVDRSARRAAIPQHPTRTAMPPAPTNREPAPARDRSAIVQQMIALRAKPRGKVIGV